MKRTFQLALKRAIDLGLSLTFAIIFFPLFLGLALLVRIFIGTPVFFRQKRGGLGGSVFEIIKFTTMCDRRDVNGVLLSDESRLTGLGKILRTLSLDELPELINVIRGDMSLIGPRPLLAEYLPLYSEAQWRRHEMRPGLTGWAQVNGRNLVGWHERFEMDVWYVDNWSMALDLKILFLTLVKVLTMEGIGGEGCATMPKFTGACGEQGITHSKV